jgi:hypothetical protein
MKTLSSQWQEHKSAIKAAAGGPGAAAEEGHASALGSSEGGEAEGVGEVQQAAASLLDRFEQLSVA